MFDTKIPLYSIFILLSLLVNIIVIMVIYKKFKFSRDEIIGALVYENIGIIVGAKLLTFIQNYRLYGEFDFFNLGLSSYGGVIGATICLIIFGIQFKKPLKGMLFTFMPSIPIMYAIGKIGCFVAGCCYGIEYNGIGNVMYNFSNVAKVHTHYFPVQILETLAFVFIFIYMINRIFKNRFTWKTLGISFILCGLAKFALDFLRSSHINVFLSLNQILSLIFILIGLILFFLKKKEHNLEAKK